MNKTTWYVIGGVVLVAGIIGIVLYMAGQQAQAAAPVVSSDLPAGGNAAGIFSTIWAGVGQVTGGIIAASTSNEPPAQTGTEAA